MASRFVPLFREYESLPAIATLTITSSSPEIPRSYNDDDEDDNDLAQSKPFNLTLPVFQASDSTLLLPLAPHIPIAAAHSLASALTSQALLQKLLSSSPQITILTTTGGSASSGRVGTPSLPVSYLQTTAAAASSTISKSYTQLAPPNAIQGPPAAILAQAELKGVAATALVVAGEGPLDHEQVDPDGLLAISHAARSTYGLQKTLSTLPSQSYHMYL